MYLEDKRRRQGRSYSSVALERRWVEAAANLRVERLRIPSVNDTR